MSSLRSLAKASHKIFIRVGALEAAPIQLPVYLVSEVPSPSPAGQLLYVSDEVGGATLAFSDGNDWRRVSDNAVISD